MKALLKEDIIIRLSIDVGVEVGNIPSGVSIDRMRWDGERLVDLLALRAIHVRVLGGGSFELHAVPLTGTHLVEMSYKQRKQLRVGVDGVPFMADKILVESEDKEGKIKAAEVKLCGKLGGQEKQLQSLMAFVSALIVYAGEEPAALKTFFRQIAPDIREAYPAGRYLEILRASAKDLRECLGDYHTEVDKINSKRE